MKNIVIIIAAVMFMALGNIENVFSQTTGSGTVRLGRGDNCDGIGVCAMDVTIWGIRFLYNEHKLNRNENERMSVNTLVNEKKNVFILSFSVSELIKKDPSKAKELEKGKLYIDEDIKFNTTKPIILKKGIYDVVIKGDIATIEVDMK